MPRDLVVSNIPVSIVSNDDDITIESRSKNVTIGHTTHALRPKQLCRIIMHTTQQIGEYKAMNNPYSAYVVNALRKARNDMVSDLETNFSIGHRIGNNGQSIFYYL